MNMNRGFTLIELLIVIVMISALVGVALPKYQRAVERGRALEGINNVKYAAEYVGTKYYINDMENMPQTVRDVVKSKYFTAPSVNTDTKEVTISRKGNSGWNYTLSATTDAEGEVGDVYCTPKATCDELGINALLGKEN